MLGGTCGFVGTVLLGPRSGIFDKKTVNTMVKAANMKKKFMSQKQGVDAMTKGKYNMI